SSPELHQGGIINNARARMSLQRRHNYLLLRVSEGGHPVVHVLSRERIDPSPEVQARHSRKALERVARLADVARQPLEVSSLIGGDMHPLGAGKIERRRLDIIPVASVTKHQI